MPEEGLPGADDVVILSYQAWQQRFDEDRNVIGATLWIDRVPATVVGVMPAGFDYMYNRRGYNQFWIPARLTEAEDMRLVVSVARLAPGVTLEQAQLAMDVIARRDQAESVDAGLPSWRPESSSQPWGVNVLPLSRSLSRSLSSDIRPSLMVLWSASVVVLLVAWANAAGLLVARGVSRRKDFALRMALGASRWRVARLFLAEGVLLTLAGGALGSLMAIWGVRVIRLMNPDNNSLIGGDPITFPRLDEASVDLRVLGYTLLVSVLTALLLSIAPAIRGSKLELDDSLKESTRSAPAGSRRLRLRGGLVVAQVALTLVLLSGAGLLVNTMLSLWEVDPGFSAAGLLTFKTQLEADRYWEEPSTPGEAPTALSPRLDAFFEQVLDRLVSLPGVDAAAAINILPLSHQQARSRFVITGRPIPAGDEPWHGRIGYAAVMGGYFDVMGIPLLRGRAVTEGDTAAAPWVVVINQSMAERFWPDEDPIGRQMTIVGHTSGAPIPGERPREVIGVVGDVHRWSLQKNPEPMMYVPAVQQPLEALESGRLSRRLQMSYVLRTAGEPMRWARQVQSVVAQIDPDQPVHAVAPMQELFTIWTDGARFYTMLIVAFAAATLALSLIGIYGMLVYSVTRRTNEIGIRMALGARRAGVMKLVVREGLALAASGVAIGLVGAYWLTGLISALQFDSYDDETILYGISPTDPANFAAVAALMLAVALLACYRPVRHATRVDPMTALRSE